ncbi:MAG: hypothetical protein JJ913_14915 [Rhizobiaceae bacterium]|nr:hypothetical protein [Rhizobiaceae bacterium]
MTILRAQRKLAALILASAAAIATLTVGAAAGERCQDRRIVRFGETTASIAQRCGLTPGAVERQNPGIHIAGASQGTRINVPPPVLPSSQLEIRGNRAISGQAGGVGIRTPINQ